MFGLVIHHHLCLFSQPLLKELSLPETVPGGMAAYRQTLAVLGSPETWKSRNHPGKPEKSAVLLGGRFWAFYEALQGDVFLEDDLWYF